MQRDREKSNPKHTQIEMLMVLEFGFDVGYGLGCLSMCYRVV